MVMVKSKSTNLRRNILTWILVATVALLVVHPPSSIPGGLSNNPYSALQKELDRTKESKVLLLGSWNDYYSIEYNSYWRIEMGKKFVEREYGEVLMAASFGDDFFNRYLNSRKITHVLVPLGSAESGVVRYKFGTLGTIELKLSYPYFMKVGENIGPNPSVLFKVLNYSTEDPNLVLPTYEIFWKNVESGFFTLQEKTEEIGIYRLLYSSFYENGPEVSWFFKGESDGEDSLEIGIKSLPSYLDKVMMEITLVAAYGPNAPSHTVLVKTTSNFENLNLGPNSPAVFNVDLRSGESVNIENVTPCRLPKTFEPSDLDTREICFGISKILIRL
jgi:hypothetical protein